MQIELKAYLGTAVFTKSGQAIGKLADVQLDSETGRLSSLIVKAKGLVQGLLEEHLIIPWNAVIEMTQEKIVVTDVSVKEPASSLAVSTTSSAAPGLMKEG